MAVSPGRSASDAAAAIPRDEWTGLVLEHSAHAIAILDAAGRVQALNDRALTVHGGRREDAIGGPAWALLSGEKEATAFHAHIGRAVAGETIRYGQPTLRDNVPIVLDVSITPIPDATGSPGHLLMEWQEAWESASAHELELSRQKFAGIVNISSDAIVSVDDEFRITDFNLGAERIFGYAAREILGQSLDTLIPARFRESHQRHMRAFSQGSTDARRMGERREISGLRKGGEEFPADASISKLDVDGKRIFTVVLRDITKQKQTESMQRFLAQAGSLLASSLDITATHAEVARLASEIIGDACVFFGIDAQRRVRITTIDVRRSAHEPIAARWRGQAVDPDSPHPVNQVVRTGRPLLLRDVEAAFGEAERQSGDLVFLREMGVRSALFAPMVTRGQVMGAIGLYRTASSSPFTPEDLADVEDLALMCALAGDNAQLYRAAIEAVRARDDILAVVSHDLGSPLSAIRIGVSLLLRATPSAAQHGPWEHLAGIKQSVEQMERLIRDLLEIKRIEAGQLVLDFEPVPPAALVSSATEMLAPLAASKSISIRSRVDAAAPLVIADRERVIQALLNLVGNALKFTAEGGHVEVRADAGANEVVFSVIDNGPGIAVEDLEHIFDRFWQARRSRQAGTSLGLGLAIVKGIVQAHAGRVWAESAPGVGMTVCFTLPLASDTATQAA